MVLEAFWLESPEFFCLVFVLFSKSNIYYRYINTIPNSFILSEPFVLQLSYSNKVIFTTDTFVQCGYIVICARDRQCPTTTPLQCHKVPLLRRPLLLLLQNANMERMHSNISEQQPDEYANLTNRQFGTRMKLLPCNDAVSSQLSTDPDAVWWGWTAALCLWVYSIIEVSHIEDLIRQSTFWGADHVIQSKY